VGEQIPVEATLILKNRRALGRGQAASELVHILVLESVWSIRIERTNWLGVVPVRSSKDSYGLAQLASTLLAEAAKLRLCQL